MQLVTTILPIVFFCVCLYRISLCVCCLYLLIVSIGHSNSKRVLPVYRLSVENFFNRYCSWRSVSGLPTDCLLSCFVGVSLHVSLCGHYDCNNACLSAPESIEYIYHSICGKTV